MIRIGALMLVASSAQADEPFVPQMLQTRLGLHAAYWPAVDATLATFEVQARVRVQRHLALDLEAPWVVGQLKSGSGTLVEPGNIVVGLHGGSVLSSGNTSIVGGVLIAIPTTYRVPETNAGLNRLSLLTFAAASESLFDPDRFYPEFGFVRLPFDVEVEARPWLRIRMEASLVFWVPIGRETSQAVPSGNTPLSGTPEASVQVSFEQGAEIEFRHRLGITGGLRTEIVAASTPSGSDSYSMSSPGISAELFVGYEPAARGLFARLGWLAGTSALYVPYDANNVLEWRLCVGYRL